MSSWRSIAYTCDSSLNFPHATTQTNTYARQISTFFATASGEGHLYSRGMPDKPSAEVDDRRGARARAGRQSGDADSRMPRPCLSRTSPTAGTARSGGSATTSRCGSPAARSRPRSSCTSSRCSPASRRGCARSGVGVPAPVVDGRPGCRVPVVVVDRAVVRRERRSRRPARPSAPAGRCRSRRRSSRCTSPRPPDLSRQSRSRGVPLAERADAVAARFASSARARSRRPALRAGSTAVGCGAGGAGLGRRAGLDPRRPSSRQPRRPRLRARRDHRLRRRHRRRPGLRPRGRLAGVRRRRVARRSSRRSGIATTRRRGHARTAGRRQSRSCCSTRATTIPSTSKLGAEALSEIMG